MLDKTTVMNIANAYADAVKKDFSPLAVVLFGSYVRDEARDDSDIDIGVVFEGFEGDWLTTASALWRLRHGISYVIEPHLLDVKQDKSGFVRHVFKTGQVIYHA
ncbi:MAG: nucleotidyltransferase domain-containing protein [Clostridiales bacterium]|jgi:predicted nucleotidyltransferase|nr:nucleotidyltransferase domain-containing protein [Clostridiales bacterium]